MGQITRFRRSFFEFIQGTPTYSLKTPLDDIIKRFKWKYVLTFSIFLTLWQLSFLCFAVGPPSSSRSVSGFMHETGKEFFYFFYYLDLFPVASEVEPKDFSKEGAEKLLTENGNSIVMEKLFWSRLGEPARPFVYYVKSFFTGSAQNPSIIPFNILTFVVCLLALFLSLSLLGYYCFATILSILVGSSPYIIKEIYFHENILALGITGFILIMAIYTPFIVKKNHVSTLLLVTFLLGIIIASICNIRAEFKALLICLGTFVILLPNRDIFTKTALLACMILSYKITNLSWNNFYIKKFAESEQIVSKYGGHVYSGHKIPTHTFWHAVFCGFGDYAEQLGYKWDDKAGQLYAIDIYNKKFNTELSIKSSTQKTSDYLVNEYYDQAGKYPIYLEILPGYEEIIRDKVVKDITENPLIFITVYIKRLIRYLVRTSPVSLFSVGKLYIPLPFIGLFAILLLFALNYRNQTVEFVLLSSSIPLGISSLLIFSKGNSTYQNVYHLVALAILLTYLIDFIYKSKGVRSGQSPY
jgi:hypothetical protein